MSLKVAEMTRVVSAVPDDWREVTLGDIISLEYGRSLPDKVRRAGGVAVYGSNGVVGTHDEALVPTGGIIVGRKGTAGSVTVSPGPFWPIDTTYFVKAHQPVDWDWLAATLYQARLNELNEATGVPGLNRDKAYRQPLVLPPLDEQRRIAGVLRSVDEVLHLTTTTLAVFLSVKNGVLRDVIAHDTLPDGWVLSPIDSLGAKVKHAIVDGPFGSNLKSEHYRSAGIPVFQSGFVTSSQFKPTKYVFVDEALFQQQIRSRAVGGDILMAKIGAQAGRCAIIPSAHRDGIIAGNCLKITVDQNRCSAAFLHTVLTYMYGVTGLREIITETAQPAISLARLKTLLVPLPPLAEQAVIMNEIQSLNLAIEAETRNRIKLIELKRALMSDLLSGQVRVLA